MPLHVEPLDVDSSDGYDLLIVAVGYEHRSMHLIRAGFEAKQVLAFPFGDLQDCFAFPENLDLAQSSGAVILDTGSDEDFGDVVLAVIELILSEADISRVAVDVSSFSRVRLASILWALRASSPASRGLRQIDFLYSPAQFSTPAKSTSSILTAAPVSKHFRGKLRPMSIPLGVIFGLGYEPQRAVGAFELMEPVRSWAFRSNAEQREYWAAVSEANSTLLKSLPENRHFEYSVGEPVNLYYALESLCFSIRDVFRLALVPMGPKIFALACMLVALDGSESRPAVWRVGERNRSEPQNAIADGTIVGLRWVFTGEVAGKR